MSTYRILQGHENGAGPAATQAFAYDVLVGLSERPKRLPSKYFYDDQGSRYFQRIMGLDEYYPTRCEREILLRHAQDIVAPARAGGPFHLVDLGAGDGAKTMILLRALSEAKADFTYVPIDISEGAMRAVVAAVERELPELRIEGLVTDYLTGLHWLSQHEPDKRSLVLFLGSNIGNFNRVQARAFLRRLWNAMNDGDYALVGFDLKKDIEALLAAYNDREGVTAAFNLNLLQRINRELDADFDVQAFRHYGTYDVFSGAMESYLVSLKPQIVKVGALEMSFPFDAWEPIHTEYSYKYLRSDVTSLAEDTGFECLDRFEDDRNWFLDALWKVRKVGLRTPPPRA
ncbi:MAG: L-histidine N(alpha)-methyltransferase [Sandaracinaceae bacterium]